MGQSKIGVEVDEDRWGWKQAVEFEKSGELIRVQEVRCRANIRQGEEKKWVGNIIGDGEVRYIYKYWVIDIEDKDSGVAGVSMAL